MPQKKKIKTISPEDAVISNYLMQKNKDKNFVQRAYDPNRHSIQVPGYFGTSTHLMAYDPASQRVYPEVVQHEGQLQYKPEDAAWNYADSTGEYINMPNSEKTMKMFSGYGYKHAAGMPIYQNGGTIMQKTIRIKAAPQYAVGGYAQQVKGELSIPWSWANGRPSNESQVDVRTTLPKVPRDMANAVLENDEIAMIPTEDGMGVQKAASDSHASGNDHPTVLEEGSMILSDTKSLKEKDAGAQKMFNKPYKKGGYTYSELGKPFMGVFNRAEKGLNKKDIDPMQEKTLAMNQQNAMNKLQQVFQLQEMRKQERGIPTGPTTMAAGGQYKGPYSPTYYQQQQHIQDKPQAVMLANLLYGQPNAGQYSDGIDGYRTDFVENYRPNINAGDNSNIGTLPAVDGVVSPIVQQRMNPVSIPSSLYPQTGTNKTDKTGSGKSRGVSNGITAANISDAVTAAKLLSIKKHLPWEPAVNVKYPNWLPISDQPIRNVLAEQTNQLANAMYSGDTKAGRAGAQNGQAELLKRSVQAAGEVGNINNQSYSQYEQLRSQLGTSEDAAKRERAKRIYDGTIIANQQYTNAMNAGLDVVAKTAAEREEQAAFLHNQNMTNPYYQLDRTGKLRWNSENTRDKYLSEVLAGRPGSGVSGNEGALYKQLVDQYSEYMSTEAAEKAAFQKVFGTSQTVREKTKVGNKETVKTTKQKYGGYMNKLPKK
jgi:hypothetical protein